MNETPRPLMVLAITATGGRRPDGLREERPRSGAMSWPSISMTRQPNAVHFADKLARDLRRQPVVGRVALPAVLLQLVVVDDRNEVVESVARRDERGLPDLALLALAVTEQCVRPCVCGLESAAEGDAHRGRYPHPERPGRHVEARQARHVGVALQA